MSEKMQNIKELLIDELSKNQEFDINDVPEIVNDFIDNIEDTFSQPDIENNLNDCDDGIELKDKLNSINITKNDIELNSPSSAVTMSEPTDTNPEITKQDLNEKKVDTTATDITSKAVFEKLSYINDDDKKKQTNKYNKYNTMLDKFEDLSNRNTLKGILTLNRDVSARNAGIEINGKIPSQMKIIGDVMNIVNSNIFETVIELTLLAIFEAIESKTEKYDNDKVEKPIDSYLGFDVSDNKKIELSNGVSKYEGKADDPVLISKDGNNYICEKNTGEILYGDNLRPETYIEKGVIEDAKMKTDNELSTEATQKGMSLEEYKDSLIDIAKENYCNKIEKSIENRLDSISSEKNELKIELDYDKARISKLENIKEIISGRISHIEADKNPSQIEISAIKSSTKEEIKNVDHENTLKDDLKDIEKTIKSINTKIEKTEKAIERAENTELGYKNLHSKTLSKEDNFKVATETSKTDFSTFDKIEPVKKDVQLTYDKIDAKYSKDLDVMVEKYNADNPDKMLARGENGLLYNKYGVSELGTVDRGQINHDDKPYLNSFRNELIIKTYEKIGFEDFKGYSGLPNGETVAKSTDKSYYGFNVERDVINKETIVHNIDMPDTLRIECNDKIIPINTSPLCVEHNESVYFTDMFGKVEHIIESPAQPVEYNIGDVIPNVGTDDLDFDAAIKNRYGDDADSSKFKDEYSQKSIDVYKNSVIEKIDAKVESMTIDKDSLIKDKTLMDKAFDLPLFHTDLYAVDDVNTFNELDEKIKLYENKISIIDSYTEKIQDISLDSKFSDFVDISSISSDYENSVTGTEHSVNELCSTADKCNNQFIEIMTPTDFDSPEFLEEKKEVEALYEKYLEEEFGDSIVRDKKDDLEKENSTIAEPNDTSKFDDKEKEILSDDNNIVDNSEKYNSEDDFLDYDENYEMDNNNFEFHGLEDDENGAKYDLLPDINGLRPYEYCPFVNDYKKDLAEKREGLESQFEEYKEAYIEINITKGMCQSTLSNFESGLEDAKEKRDNNLQSILENKIEVLNDKIEKLTQLEVDIKDDFMSLRETINVDKTYGSLPMDIQYAEFSVHPLEYPDIKDTISQAQDIRSEIISDYSDIVEKFNSTDIGHIDIEKSTGIPYNTHDTSDARFYDMGDIKLGQEITPSSNDMYADYESMDLYFKENPTITSDVFNSINESWIEDYINDKENLMSLDDHYENYIEEFASFGDEPLIEKYSEVVADLVNELKSCNDSDIKDSLDEKFDKLESLGENILAHSLDGVDKGLDKFEQALNEVEMNKNDIDEMMGSFIDSALDFFDSSIDLQEAAEAFEKSDLNDKILEAQDLVNDVIRDLYGDEVADIIKDSISNGDIDKSDIKGLAMDNISNTFETLDNLQDKLQIIINGDFRNDDIDTGNSPYIEKENIADNKYSDLFDRNNAIQSNDMLVSPNNDTSNDNPDDLFSNQFLQQETGINPNADCSPENSLSDEIHNLLNTLNPPPADVPNIDTVDVPELLL